MQEIDIPDPEINSQLKQIAPDTIRPFLLENVRGYVLSATKMVNQMRTAHELGILETLILGHGYMAAALMSATLKNRDRLQIRVECTGPARGLSVETNSQGDVRGRLFSTQIPLDSPLESFDMAPFLGQGHLSVTKYPDGQGEPFTGTIALGYGSIAKDLANYYTTSEQIPTALYLSIFFDKAGRVMGAGGIFIQALPGAEESLLEDLSKTLGDISSLSTHISLGKTPDQIIELFFQDLEPKFLPEKPVQFFCSCSKERFSRFIANLEYEDLQDMLQSSNFPMETRCQQCGSSYHFLRHEIQEMLHKRN